MPTACACTCAGGSTGRIWGHLLLRLPFGLTDSLHGWTPAVVLIAAYPFLGLDAVGDEIEDPFGTEHNDLALTSLSRMMETNLLQSLGDKDLPEPLRPSHGVLS